MSYNVASKNNDLYNSLDTLTIISASISTEGFGSFLSKVSSFFVSKIEYAREALGISSKQAKSVSNEHNAYVEDLLKNKKDMQYVVNNLSYSILENARVMAPVGIKVDLLKACKELKEGIKLINTEVFKSLDSLDDYISNVLNDADFRTQTRPQKADKNAIDYSTKLYSVLNTCVDDSKVEDTTKLKELLPNLNSLQKVYEELVDLSDLTSVDKIKEINDAVDAIYVKVEALEKELNTTFEVSKVVLKKLVEDLESNAKLVTVAINTIYLYNQTVLCVNNIIRRFRDMKA